MVKETTGFGIQGCDLCHIFRAQFKIENSDIFEHPFLVDGFSQRNDASLDNPAENDLGHTFIVPGSDCKQGFILENIISALGKRRPGFNLNAVFL